MRSEHADRHESHKRRADANAAHNRLHPEQYKSGSARTLRELGKQGGKFTRFGTVYLAVAVGAAVLFAIYGIVSLLIE